MLGLSILLVLSRLLFSLRFSEYFLVIYNFCIIIYVRIHYFSRFFLSVG